MSRSIIAIAVFVLAACAMPASAHSEHTRVDSVEGAAMAAVVVDFHRLFAAGDSTAYRHLAPAYVQAEMGERRDPRTWRPSGTTPDEFLENLREEPPADGYRNDVEVVHTRVRGTGGIVVTHEVGSYLDDGWDAYNVWILVRVDGAWRIGASLHDLPRDVLDTTN